jgi:hypothetical protein
MPVPSFTSSHFIALLEELKDAPTAADDDTPGSSAWGRRGSVFGGGPRSGGRRGSIFGFGSAGSSGAEASASPTPRGGNGRRGGLRGGTSTALGPWSALAGEELLEEETPLGRLSVRLRHPRADAARGVFGRLLRRKRPRPGGAGGSRGPGSGAASAKRTHRGLGYFRLNEAAEEDETLEALDQFEVKPPSLSSLRARESCAFRSRGCAVLL